jgi:hypothetical protein
VYSCPQNRSGSRALSRQNKLPPFCASGLSGIGYIHLYAFRVFEGVSEHVFHKKACPKRARNCAQTGVVFGPSLRAFRGGLGDRFGALIPVPNRTLPDGGIPHPDASYRSNPDLPDPHLERLPPTWRPTQPYGYTSFLPLSCSIPANRSRPPPDPLGTPPGGPSWFWTPNWTLRKAHSGDYPPRTPNCKTGG